MKRPVVAIVYLGRDRARGEVARVRSWEAIVAKIGADVMSIRLMQHHRPRLADTLRFPSVLARGKVVVEAAAWSPSSVRRLLDRTRPAAVVCVTVRAFHPMLAGGGRTTVLDHVDSLSESYRDRALIARSLPRRLVYQGVTRTASRFDAGREKLPVVHVAAGFGDATTLGAKWIPNVVSPLPDARPIPSERDSVDVCFVGTLSYPPNVEAIHMLARAWPAVLAERPSASALLAGGSPIKPVRRLAAELHWELQPDFNDSNDIYRRSRLAVAPLRTASGIQNKVLEAAAFAVPVIATPQALTGFEPPFPAAVVRSADEVSQQILALLADPSAAYALGTAGRRCIERTYAAGRWRDEVAGLLGI